MGVNTREMAMALKFDVVSFINTIINMLINDECGYMVANYADGRSITTIYA